jgi:hypothetical protein
MINVIGSMLPSFTETWIRSFVSQPGLFMIIISFIGLGLIFGGRLQRRSADVMRALWYTVPKLAPLMSSPTPLEKSCFQKCIEGIRTSIICRYGLRALSHYIIPALSVITVFWILAAIISQITFDIAVAPTSCTRSANPLPVTTEMPGHSLDTKALCNATGLSVQKAVFYQVALVIPAAHPWFDKNNPAHPDHVEPSDVGTRILMFIGVPFRRHIAHPWFKVMATIGGEEYALNLKKMPGKNDGPSDTNRWETEILPGSDGELFIYVNDVVLPPPVADSFYSDNRGTADVFIKPLTP